VLGRAQPAVGALPVLPGQGRRRLFNGKELSALRHPASLVRTFKRSCPRCSRHGDRAASDRSQFRRLGVAAEVDKQTDEAGSELCRHRVSGPEFGSAPAIAWRST
jgi:hypothetical protein